MNVKLVDVNDFAGKYKYCGPIVSYDVKLLVLVRWSSKTLNYLRYLHHHLYSEVRMVVEKLV